MSKRKIEPAGDGTRIVCRCPESEGGESCRSMKAIDDKTFKFIREDAEDMLSACEGLRATLLAVMSGGFGPEDEQWFSGIGSHVRSLSAASAAAAGIKATFEITKQTQDELIAKAKEQSK